MKKQMTFWKTVCPNRHKEIKNLFYEKINF